MPAWMRSRSSGSLPISIGFSERISCGPSIEAGLVAEPRKAWPSSPASVWMRSRPRLLSRTRQSHPGDSGGRDVVPGEDGQRDVIDFHGWFPSGACMPAARPVRPVRRAPGHRRLTAACCGIRRSAAGCRCACSRRTTRRRLLGVELHRREAAALVRAVAERLLAALAAGAPPVRLPGLDIDFIGALLGDHRQ